MGDQVLDIVYLAPVLCAARTLVVILAETVHMGLQVVLLRAISPQILFVRSLFVAKYMPPLQF